MKKRLTQAGVEKVPNPKKGQIDIFDEVLPGFGLRAGKTAKTYFVMYRAPGTRQKRRMRLGHVGVIKLADAREAAREAMRQVQAGVDPIEVKAEAEAERERQNLAEERAGQFTVAKTCDRFLKNYVEPRLKSARDVEAIFRLHVIPAIGAVQIDDLTRRDVVRILDGLVAEGKERTAAKTLAHLRKMLNWLMGRGEIDSNPVAGIPSPAPIRHRDRVLSDDELLTVWNAAGDLGHPFGPFYRLLILTGARRSEVGGMQWAEYDKKARTWTIPASRSKNGVAHIVPLPDAAVDLIAGLPKSEGGDYLFGRGGAGALAGFGRAKVRLDKLAGIEPWRVHDLRRTFATAHQRIGTRLEVVEALLNHTSGSRAGIVGVYQRHDWADEKRIAMDAFDRWLRALIADEKAETDGNVVALPRR